MRWLCALTLLCSAPAAWANGAFPDELQVFAPANQPDTTVVGTNYGLLATRDDAQHWTYVCEPAIAATLVTAYGVGAAGALYALAGSQILTSSDSGCTWTAGTTPPLQTVSDLFASPTDPTRALAIGLDPSVAFGVYVTADSGLTWTGPTIASPSGHGPILGVEIARSNAMRAYASAYQIEGGTHTAVVSRSDDSGQTWTALPHAELGNVYPFIAAVDPADANTLWLRLVSATGAPDALAVSHDAGVTFTVVLTAPGTLSALAVGEDHTVWAGDRAGDLWRLDPGGAAFTLGTGPAVRCLAERAGTLYACGDPQKDGFVLGASTDRGNTFTAVVTSQSYQTLACALTAGACPAVNVAPPDAGAPDAGHPATAQTTGCGCNTDGGLVGLGLLIALLGLSARRGRASRSCGPACRSAPR